MQVEKMSPLLKSMESIEQGLNQVGTSMLQNWRNVGSALRTVFQQIGTSLIQELVIKPMAAKAAAAIRQRVFAMLGIGADAAKAGAGAASAVANKFLSSGPRTSMTRPW
jgi:hypothetical protein